MAMDDFVSCKIRQLSCFAIVTFIEHSQGQCTVKAGIWYAMNVIHHLLASMHSRVIYKSAEVLRAVGANM